MTNHQKNTENKALIIEPAGLADRGAIVDLRKILMIVAMTAAVFSSAWAGDIMPRHDSVVTANVVTVGDVFKGITRHADHVLAPAPAPGETLELSAKDLLRISDAFGFGWHPQSAMDQVTIRRDAVDIDRYQIEAALQERLATKLPGRHFELALDAQSQHFYVPSDNGARLDVVELNEDLLRGSFNAVLAAGDLRQNVQGTLHLMTQIPVLQQPVRSGDIIRAADVTYVDIRERDVSAKAVLHADQLIGQSARRSLPALRPLSATDVVEPLLVKKGDLVTLTLQDSIMHLTTQGKALENGAAGASVRVMNTSSRQVVDAVVTGMQSVAVRAPGRLGGT